jgi:hypothetical protein
MRTRFVCLSFGALAWLLPVASSADDVQEQLRQMQDRMTQMEDRLQATTDQLDDANDRVERQQELIDRSGLAELRPGTSGLASFLDTLEIGGWVAGSYFYNFNEPNGESLAGANAGATGFAYPFHPDANSFSVDQLWFELERPVDESNRAGFRADITFGKTASVLGSSQGTASDGLSLDETDLEVYQAYVQYLAPIAEGVTFKFGKFGTTIGTEVAPTIYNWNITRGNVYNLFEPITHVGIIANMPFAEYFDVSLGYVNEDVSDVDIDLNRNKGVLWRLGFTQETFSLAFNGVWGSTNSALGTTIVGGSAFGEGALESDKEHIFNLIFTWDPLETFSMWINADYRTVEIEQVDSLEALFPGDSVDGWGVAVAGRAALTERLGLALRGEYVDDQDSFFTRLGTSGFANPGDATKIFSVTSTLDYSLTEKLLVRGELRYDVADVQGTNDDAVYQDDEAGEFEDDQMVAGVEVVYKF